MEEMEAPLDYAWGVVGHLMGVDNSDELRDEPTSLDEAQTRIVDSSLMSMKLSGVGLEGEEKERFNAIRLELGELSTQYSNNVLDATKAFSLTLTEKSQVK